MSNEGEYLTFDVNIDSKIVVNSIYSDDSVINIWLSTSGIITEPYNSNPTVFLVSVYENDELRYTSQANSGKLNTHIRPNVSSKYKIEVSSNSFSSVSTTDSVPSIVGITNAEFVFPIAVDEFGDYLGEAQVTFSDPVECKNYYELLINVGVNNYFTGFMDYPITDPIILNEGDLDYYPSSIFFSDELINGQSYTLKIKVAVGVVINSEGIKPSSELYAELRSVSKNYYLYRKYLTRHLYNQQMNNKDFYDYLYNGEPVDMYSNIINGYGIFAGYQSSMSKLNLKN
ncbi:MAG: hypothetical protein CVU09_17410 [Bacteroidetes bacterium HGW-Bacteroidetes-4]|nr:MAG: hypothetical protein CVU09_17410 [Bacteroidetes bacterium HGW-Bacteroidetes-4]